MPRISTFHGIVIWMYYDDHPPAHFHATHGDDVAQVQLDGELLAGSLPTAAMRRVRTWTELHAAELAVRWARAQAHEPLGNIDPLP